MTTLIIAEALSITTSLMYPIASLSANLLYSAKFLFSLSDDTEIKILTKRISDTVEDIELIRKFIEHKDTSIEKNTALSGYIESLSKALVEAEDAIFKLTRKVERHKKKWFHKYRGYNISVEKSNVNFALDKVHRKFDLITKIFQSM